jgi:hypothetical protein
MSLDSLPASRLVRASCLGKERRSAVRAAQAPRLGSEEAGAALLHSEAELTLDPARKRIF